VVCVIRWPEANKVYGDIHLENFGSLVVDISIGALRQKCWQFTQSYTCAGAANLWVSVSRRFT
jgi:hypothetical protein